MPALFGGPHQSMPSFVRYRVRPDDSVFVVRLVGGVLHLVSRVDVREVISLEAWLQREGLNDESLRAKTFQDPYWPNTWLKHRPNMACLASTCCDDVLVPTRSSEIQFENPIAVEDARTLRVISGKSERSLVKPGVTDGTIRATTMQGHILRLSAASHELMSRYA